MEATEVMAKTKWNIDPVHSEIGFRVKHLMVSNIRGEFTEYDTSIYTTADDFLSSEIDIDINPASISTGDAARDSHLKGADFFNVKKFNGINFRGKGFEEAGCEMYVLNGDLTMKGITKRIRLDVEFNGVTNDPWGGKRAGFVVTGKINRKDWELTWSELIESSAVVVGEDIFIKCEIELIKQSGQLV
jgi:polyisoprenoid-binding protein YceI